MVFLKGTNYLWNKTCNEESCSTLSKAEKPFSQQIFFVQQKCGVAMAPLSRLPQLHRPCSSFFTSRNVASVNSQLQSFLRFKVCIYVNKHIFQLLDDLKEYSGLRRYLQWEKVIYQRLGPDFHIFYQSSLLSLSQPEVAALYPSIPHDVKNVKRLQKTMDFLMVKLKLIDLSYYYYYDDYYYYYYCLIGFVVGID